MADDSILMVWTTCGRGDARALAEVLVGERLVACVNVGDVESVYRWQGEVACEPEALLTMKTTRARWESLQRRLAELHPYDVPEIVAVAAAEVGASYGAWVVESVGETAD